MTTIRGKSIGYRIVDFLKSRAAGKIFSVHANSVYCLIGNGHLVIVHDGRFGAVPFGLSVSRSSDCFDNYDIRKGMQINLSQFKFGVPETNFSIHLNSAEVWRPRQSIPPIPSFVNARSNLDFALQYLRTKGSREGLGGLITVQDDLFTGRKDTPKELNPFCQLAFYPLSNLIASIEKKDLYSLGKPLTKLIGLGLGLTPSMDDVLIGLISALYFLKDSSSYGLGFTSTLGKMIFSLSRGKTTIVSETFLKYACLGDVYEILDNVLFALLFCSRQKLSSVIDKVISMGATSGTELMVGVLIGFRLILKGTIGEQSTVTHVN